ncbi:MAG: type 4a pilus biogenesis protein PilO [Phycisphaerales bacterium]|nr:type 4a pilus biogenesis protein PilO [Phycisphaerales bacterium]
MNSILRQLVFLAVLSGVPVLAWHFVFTPQNDRIDSIQADIHARQSKIDSIDRLAASANDMNDVLESGLRAIELIESKLPVEQDVESILEHIWSIARQHQLVVKSVKSELPVPAMVYMEQPLAVELEGPFTGFYAFLRELESLPRITRMFNLQLQHIDTLSGPRKHTLPPGSVNAQFLLSIYFTTHQADMELTAR